MLSGFAVAITAFAVTGCASCELSGETATAQAGGPPGGGAQVESELLRSDSWDQGVAEVARYRGEERRYGVPRPAELTLITVKEDFDIDDLVKADGPHHPNRAPVIKLNTVLTVPTGVYTYRQMASSFLLRETGHALKLTTGSQEWCGATSKVLVVRGGEGVLRTFSYFGAEGEGVYRVPMDNDVVLYDALPLWLRSLDWETASRTIRVLPKQLSSHAGEPTLISTEVRVGSPTAVELPVGSREAYPVEVTALEETYWFDVDAPHPLVRWERSDARFDLAAVDRVPYWSMNGPEDALPPLPSEQAAADISVGPDGSLALDGRPMADVDALLSELNAARGVRLQVPSDAARPLELIDALRRHGVQRFSIETR